jgi:hypothetical protein
MNRIKDIEKATGTMANISIIILAWLVIVFLFLVPEWSGHIAGKVVNGYNKEVTK